MLLSVHTGGDLLMGRGSTRAQLLRCLIVLRAEQAIQGMAGTLAPVAAALTGLPVAPAELAFDVAPQRRS